MPDVNWLALTPPLILLVTASVALLVAISRRGSRPIAALSIVGLSLAAVFNAVLFAQSQTGALATSFGLRYLADHPALAFNFIILLGTALAVLVSFDYLERGGLEHPEYYPLMLLSATGAMVLVAAGDFIVLLLGLEIMSLAVYVLSAWRQNARESEEAGMKYFLLGAFASAFLIYGIALMYGATGFFGFEQIALTLGSDGFDQGLLATLAALLIVVGLGFKASIVPFHQWAPDAYTGAPTAVTAYMSVVVKAAAFAGLVRVFSALFPDLGPIVLALFSVLVALTMIIGNLAALLQRGLKRMLAYSAVAHAGYLGLAVLAAGDLGTQAVAWYMLAYVLMNVGAFAVLTLIADANDHGDDLERFAGLSQQKPWLAAAMALFMLSLAGIPPLAGFTGKILVFQAALQAGYYLLAVVGILTSAIAIFYYFRVITYMYFRDPEYVTPNVESRATNLAIGVTAVGTVLLGIFPGWWYGLLSVGQRFVAGVAGL
ncbi:MAG: NADH-quinone oxidoreductase subunit N [Trueperaceae bacterium]|nr:NADH-quinone oxidoreductase subunit N [Trueperaceae bacterium]